ncbi:hypothetical protein NHH03_01160 [Stieleria sp. TO1_6]|uniref:hypothetical protein n=1 Tax=Stieleria tagensis TaxID=2956795 RepID=UPI00209AB507|nr:hypothetical protein [Stieleria tagensis]MCO8120326.1 hypothetical protein [Stieleria tagensis]
MNEALSCLNAFGRWDVFGCGLICAVPLAVWLQTQLPPVQRTTRLMLAIGLAIVSLSLTELLGNLLPMTSVGPVSAALGRVAISTCVALSGLLLVGTKVQRLSTAWLVDPQTSPNLFPGWLTFAIVLGFASVIPAVYCDSITRGMQLTLQQSLQDQRVARANHQIRCLQQLRPRLQVDGVPLERLGQQMGDWEQKLRHQVARPLGPDPSLGQLGGRIAALIHLDQNEQALRLIRPLMTGESFHPISLDYAGLCYQRLGQAQESMDAYQRSIDFWSAQTESGKNRSAIASGWKGVAYAARRLDRRRQEEQAYQSLVTVAPTAQHHQLLAKCYRDHQKSSLAAKHAAIASEMDPSLGESTGAMLTTLARDHFSCFLIPRR